MQKNVKEVGHEKVRSNFSPNSAAKLMGYAREVVDLSIKSIAQSLNDVFYLIWISKITRLHLFVCQS